MQASTRTYQDSSLSTVVQDKQMRNAKRSRDAAKTQKRNWNRDNCLRQKRNDHIRKIPVRGAGCNLIRSYMKESVRFLNVDLSVSDDPVNKAEESVVSFGRLSYLGSPAPPKSLLTSRATYSDSISSSKNCNYRPQSLGTLDGDSLHPIINETMEMLQSCISRDDLIESVFFALFGQRRTRHNTPESYGGSWDASDEELGDEEDAVDKKSITLALDLTLCTTAASEFPCISTHQSDLLNKFINSDVIQRMVYALPTADPRTESPYLSLLCAIHDQVPNLRQCILRAMVCASYERLMRYRYHKDLANKNETELSTEQNQSINSLKWDQGQTILELLIYMLQTRDRFAHADFMSDTKHGYSQKDFDTSNQMNHSQNITNEWVPSNDFFSSSLRILCINLQCSDFVPSKGNFNPTGTTGNGLFNSKKVAEILVTVNQTASCTKLLQALCQSWPIGNPNQEVAFLSIIQSSIESAGNSFCFNAVQFAMRSLMRRILSCLRSNNMNVVKAAITITLLPTFLNVVTTHFQEYLTNVRSALAGNRNHWSPVVRELSEQSFDMLLDFCL